MTREQRNIAVVRRFIDGAIPGRDLAVVDETRADDMTWHRGSLSTYQTKAAFLEFAKANADAAWDEMHLEIHDTIASGDHVVLRFTNRGTNVGPFMGRLRGLFGRAPAFPIRRDLSPTVAELCPVRYVGE